MQSSSLCRTALGLSCAVAFSLSSSVAAADAIAEAPPPPAAVAEPPATVAEPPAAVAEAPAAVAEPPAAVAEPPAPAAEAPVPAPVTEPPPAAEPPPPSPASPAPPERVPVLAPPEPPPVGPPAGPRASAPSERPPEESLYTKRGLLGPVRLGPTVGAGVPDGLRFGVFGKWLGVLGAGAAFSFLPSTTVPVLDAQLVRASGEAFLRVHPFQGAFFLGVAGGYAQTKGTMIQQVTYFHQAQGIETHAYANAVYVAPQLGFQWMLPLGLTVGFDAGVQIPVATHEPTFDATRYGLVIPIEAQGQVADAARYVTTLPVPVIHLLEVGYAL